MSGTYYTYKYIVMTHDNNESLFVTQSKSLSRTRLGTTDSLGEFELLEFSVRND